MEKVSLARKFALIQDQWNPRIAGELNGQAIKLVKFHGPFVWHHHEHEDEMFLVFRGHFRLEYREPDGADAAVEVDEGEFVIVPRGVEHRPVAEEEVEVVLFEPMETLNTGNVRDERTRVQPGKI